jgi:hypothetical protein
MEASNHTGGGCVGDPCPTDLPRREKRIVSVIAPVVEAGKGRNYGNPGQLARDPSRDVGFEEHGVHEIRPPLSDELPGPSNPVDPIAPLTQEKKRCSGRPNFLLQA